MRARTVEVRGYTVGLLGRRRTGKGSANPLSDIADTLSSQEPTEVWDSPVVRLVHSRR